VSCHSFLTRRLSTAPLYCAEAFLLMSASTDISPAPLRSIRHHSVDASGFQRHIHRLAIPPQPSQPATSDHRKVNQLPATLVFTFFVG